MYLFGFVSLDSPRALARIPFHSAITNRPVHRWRANTTFTLACVQVLTSPNKQGRPDRFALRILQVRTRALACLAECFPRRRQGPVRRLLSLY